MKTKITATITVEREGQPPETFTGTTPACLTLDHERKVFKASIIVLEGVMTQMQKRYIQTVDDAIAHNREEEARNNAPESQG